MEWGVSTHILDLCKQYSIIEGIDKVIVCADGGEHIPTLEKISKVQYIEINFDRYGLKPSGIIKSYRAICDVIKDIKIDIIHVHSQRILPAAHLIKLFHGIPYLWTNHIDAIPQPKIFKAMCHIMQFPIISVSKQLNEMMISEYGCKSEKCYVVNNGTDLELLTPLTNEEKLKLEEQYTIDRSKRPYVISLLSRITYIKGQLFLLQAINKLCEKEKIKVIFAGHTYPDQTQYRQQLENYAAENDIDAEFLEYSKPRDVFGVSDLFVLPSLYEGFPLVCIEALAMGCPVIRSRTPGWQEMQEWTEIVDKDDIEGLAEMIHKVISNNFNREKTLAGEKAVRTVFTKERCAENTINVYKKIISISKR